MKSLLVFADDGLSDLAWIARVRSHLKSGRRVLAIDDDRRGIIGIGDGLTDYDGAGLCEYSGFDRLTVDLGGLYKPFTAPAASRLWDDLSRLNDETVVCWNMDLQEGQRALVDGELKMQRCGFVDQIFECCAESRVDMLFTVNCPPARWTRSESDIRPSQIAVLGITSIAGSRLIRDYHSKLGAENLIKISPALEPSIKQLVENDCSGHWDTITERAGDRYNFLNVRDVIAHPNHYPFLFDVL